jgi:hypothetical protein
MAAFEGPESNRPKIKRKIHVIIYMLFYDNDMKYTSKKPIQIYLDERQHRALKALAQEGGSTVAALVRESIEKYLDAIPVDKDPALRLVALAGGGPRDLAEKHDSYLAQVYSEENRR